MSLIIWASRAYVGWGKILGGGVLPIPICYKFWFWFRGRYTCNVNFLALGGGVNTLLNPPPAPMRDLVLLSILVSLFAMVRVADHRMADYAAWPTTPTDRKTWFILHANRVAMLFLVGWRQNVSQMMRISCDKIAGSHRLVNSYFLRKFLARWENFIASHLFRLFRSYLLRIIAILTFLR